MSERKGGKEGWRDGREGGKERGREREGGRKKRALSFVVHTILLASELQKHVEKYMTSAKRALIGGYSCIMIKNCSCKCNIHTPL